MMTLKDETFAGFNFLSTHWFAETVYEVNNLRYA